MSLDGFTLSTSSPETIAQLREHPELDFQARCSIRQGEVYDAYEEAEYRELKFKIVKQPYSQTVYICGNFYQYLHGQPNTGEFPFSEFLKATDQLCDAFYLKAEETKVIKLEIGCNIRTPVHPREIIDNIIAYKGRQKQFKDYKKRGYDGAFAFQEYLVRLYCKSCKNKLSDPVLRLELASEKSNYLKKFGIHHLSDLKKKENLLKLGEQLRQHVSDFIYDDLSLDLKQLTGEEMKVVQHYRLPQAWRDLMEISPDNYRKKKKRHREIIEKYSTQNWRLWLEEQLTKSMDKQFSIQ